MEGTRFNVQGSGLGNLFKILAFSILFSILAPCPLLLAPLFAEEYKFDASEVEKKPYHIGGYLEFYPIIFGLDRNAALYKANFFNRKTGATTEQYNGALQLEGSLEKGISRLYIKTYTNYTDSYQDQTMKTTVFEGNVSIKPSTSLIFEGGKKTLNWGKGYAWNPAAFLDRPKNPDDPELSREGYMVASMDYTRSFGGPLKNFTFTPVLMPVYSGFNDDFGEVDHLNFASKFYFLLYDTDIDLMFFTGGSRTTRYGMDFSRNITTDLEIHGEFSLINGYTQTSVDAKGNQFQTSYNARNYLMGLRYLTKQDTTYILEYYRNGTGLSSKEVRDYYSFVDNSYNAYTSTGNPARMAKAIALSQGPYGRMNPATNYLYFRISQKDPFDTLYWTPAITFIANTDDKSLSVMPEVSYTGVTNLELRLRTGFIVGPKGSEYGEKQNDYRMDFRARYYF